MTLCLDTNTVIDIVRGRSEPVRATWARACGSGVSIVVPTIVLHELEVGVVLSARPEVQRTRLNGVLLGCQVMDFDDRDAVEAGRLRARLQVDGRPIGAMDILIAGQALARGWTVVTRNVRHFGQVEGLPIIDWSVGSDPLSMEAIRSRVEAAD